MQAKNSETITDQLHNNCAKIPATLSQILPTLVFPPSWQTSLHWLLLLSFHLSISSNLLFNNCCVFLAPRARIDQLPVGFWGHANTAYYIVLYRIVTDMSSIQADIYLDCLWRAAAGGRGGCWLRRQDATRPRTETGHWRQSQRRLPVPLSSTQQTTVCMPLSHS